MARRKTNLVNPPDLGDTLDPAKIAQLEARNALRQYDAAMAIAEKAIKTNSFQLTPSTLCLLNRLAVEDIEQYAGILRPSNVQINGTTHQPPNFPEVPQFVDEICAYVNDNLQNSSPIHLAAYLMWRINWVHPFIEGNGRTSRIVSYMVLCIRLGHILPGSNTVPDQIAQDRQPYYEALDHADAAYKKDRIDISQMEKLLECLLAKQLLEIHNQATGS